MAYRDVILATAGLVGFWKFDEAANAGSYDDAFGSADLAPFGTQVGSGIPSVDDGVIGRALSNNGAFRVALGAFARNGVGTWEGWLRSTNTTSNNSFAIAEGASAGNPVMALGLGTGGKLRGFARNAAGAAQTLTSAATLSDGAWHHVVLTYDGTNVRLYLDGALVAGPLALAGPIGTENFAVGGRRTGSNISNQYVGDVDEVAVYSRALSAAEVADHFAAMAAVGPTPLALTGRGDAVASDTGVLRQAAVLRGRVAGLAGGAGVVLRFVALRGGVVAAASGAGRPRLSVFFAGHGAGLSDAGVEWGEPLMLRLRAGAGLGGAAVGGLSSGVVLRGRSVAAAGGGGGVGLPVGLSGVSTGVGGGAVRVRASAALLGGVVAVSGAGGVPFLRGLVFEAPAAGVVISRPLAGVRARGGGGRVEVVTRGTVSR